MKIIFAVGFVLVCAVCSAVFAAGCRKELPPPETLQKKPSGRILIVCYSQSATKNTRTAAEWIQEMTGGDLLEIEMEKPYSGNYFAILKESKKDMESNTLPAIKPFLQKTADYDIVFIGSPIWYGTFAPPVGTFLAQNDLKGKTVIPFCTHGGGGPGTFYADLQKAAPGAKVLDGIALRGSNIVERTLRCRMDDGDCKKELVSWLNRIL